MPLVRVSKGGAKCSSYLETRHIAVTYSTNVFTVDLSAYSPTKILAIYLEPYMAGVGSAYYTAFWQSDETYSETSSGRTDAFSTFTWSLSGSTLTVSFRQLGSTGQWYPVDCVVKLEMI